MMLERVELLTHGEHNEFAGVYWTLVCREDGVDGRYLWHDHEHGGHSFPLTRDDLVKLGQQIQRALAAS